MDADMMPDRAITRRYLLGQTAGCLGAAALAQLADEMEQPSPRSRAAAAVARANGAPWERAEEAAHPPGTVQQLASAMLTLAALAPTPPRITTSLATSCPRMRRPPCSTTRPWASIGFDGR